MLNLATQHDVVGIYRPRNPQASGYFRCKQDHFEQLDRLWQDSYASRYGFCTIGCLSGGSTFTKGPDPAPKDLEELFRYEVFKMLKAEGKISDAVIENMLSWHHSGFKVYCAASIWPNNDQGLEDLARYIIRACFAVLI
jgi:hypothetical protein